MSSKTISDRAIEQISKKYKVKPKAVIKAHKKGLVLINEGKIKIKDGAFPPPKTFKEKIVISSRVIKSSVKYFIYLFAISSIILTSYIGYIFFNSESFFKDKMSSVEESIGVDILGKNSKVMLPILGSGNVLKVYNPKDMSFNGGNFSYEVSADEIDLEGSFSSFGEINRLNSVVLKNYEIRGVDSGVDFYISGNGAKFNDFSIRNYSGLIDFLRDIPSDYTNFNKIKIGDIEIDNLSFVNKGSESLIFNYKGNDFYVYSTGSRTKIASSNYLYSEGEVSFNIEFESNLDGFRENFKNVSGSGFIAAKDIVLNLENLDSYVDDLYKGIILKEDINSKLKEASSGDNTKFKVNKIIFNEVFVNNGIIFTENALIKSNKVFSKENKIEYDLNTGYLNAKLKLFPISESERFNNLFNKNGLEVSIYGKLSELKATKNIQKLRDDYKEYLRELAIAKEVAKKIKK